MARNCTLVRFPDIEAYATVMKMRPAVFLFLLMSFSTPFAKAQASVELRKIVDGVNRARYEGVADHAHTITELTELAQQITTFLEKETLTPQERAAAYFFRGYARAYITNLQFVDGKKADELLASQALSDLDKVIADGIEYPQLGARISDALYVAGSVSATGRSYSRTYAYYEKCAALDHAGCLNIMAEARLTGEGNQKVDFRAAIDYHLKVFNTGTSYHCAGAYSAQSIAAIAYFTGTAAPQGDELYWINKAVDLAGQLTEERKAGACEISGMLIDEFLYQLARGDKQVALLDDASARPTIDANATNAVVGLLSGRLTPAGFSSAMGLAKNDLSRCIGYFRSFWYAELIKRHDLAQAYYQAIQRPPGCGHELVLARKFTLPPATKK